MKQYKYIYNFTLVILLVLISNTKLYAQWFLGNFNWSASLGYNSSLFHGDFTERANSIVYYTPFSKYFYEDRKSGIGFNLEKSIGPYFGVRGNLLYTKLKGSKGSINQYFDAKLFEYSLVATMNFTNIFWGIDRYRPVVFYGFVGLGMTESRTWKYDATSEKLIGTNGFGKPKVAGGKYVPMSETVMPIGLGLKVVINPNFGFYGEIALHPINTDKLDATVSNIAFWDGFGAITLGMDYYFSPSRFSSFKRHSPSYNIRSYTSINTRKYSRKSKQIFKGGKRRFKYRRK